LALLFLLRDINIHPISGYSWKDTILYPKLEGLLKMLRVFDVYISVEKRISRGEVDRYSVLGVIPGITIPLASSRASS
jgi:uncharacterized membrane protein